MKIIVNGQAKELSDATNLKELTNQLCRDCRRVITELNGHIVKPAQWQETPIKDGDTVELVTFVGGG
jgi:sulfur carrier protein